MQNHMIGSSAFLFPCAFAAKAAGITAGAVAARIREKVLAGAFRGESEANARCIKERS